MRCTTTLGFVFATICLFSLIGCEQTVVDYEQTLVEQDTLLTPSERARFSVIGKIYARYCTENTKVPFYEVRHFINQDSIKRYDTDRKDGLVGKYDNIEYEHYYFSYPYVIGIDTLYTFTKDSTVMQSRYGFTFKLVN